MGNEPSAEGNTAVQTNRPATYSSNIKDTKNYALTDRPTSTSNIVHRTKNSIMDIDILNDDQQIDQKAPLDDRQVRNFAGGFSYKICDLNRLKRFIVLGTETSTYTVTAVPSILDNINCLNGLLEQHRHEEVIKVITEFSVSGRVAKEDPILTILAKCATHPSLVVRKAAFMSVVKICNIPTKLFRFIDLSQNMIDEQRKLSPPKLQLKESGMKRKKREEVESSLQSLNLKGGQKEPTENVDATLEPAKKKKKKKGSDNVTEYKKVNEPGKKTSGWGRMRRKGIGAFYCDKKKDSCRLLYLMTKYKQRHNWSHKSVLMYSHPKMEEEHKEGKDFVIKYCTGGYDKVKDEIERVMNKGGVGVQQDTCQIMDYIKTLERVRNLKPEVEEDKSELLKIMKDYGLRHQRLEEGYNEAVAGDTVRRSPIQIVREHLPTGFLNSKDVWELLLVDMPMTALIRNLGKMSSLGLFDEDKNLDLAIKSLTNVDKLKAAKIHPVKILVALETYRRGKGDKGKLEWNVNDKILDALDDAFYKSFKQPELKEGFKTNLKYMLALDVSGSMTGGGCFGCEQLTPALSTFAMSYITWNIEGDANVDMMAFGGRFEDLKRRGFKMDMRMDAVLAKAYGMSFGATDCSLPMRHAKDARKEIDVFIVYTDNDTWSGNVHASTALRNYNQAMRRNAKLIVIGMTSSGFTVADPADPNMMDIVGFDTNVPELISEFAKGSLNAKCSANCSDCQ